MVGVEVRGPSLGEGSVGGPGRESRSGSLSVVTRSGLKVGVKVVVKVGVKVGVMIGGHKV